MTPHEIDNIAMRLPKHLSTPDPRVRLRILWWNTTQALGEQPIIEATLTPEINMLREGTIETHRKEIYEELSDPSINPLEYLVEQLAIARCLTKIGTI